MKSHLVDGFKNTTLTYMTLILNYLFLTFLITLWGPEWAGHYSVLTALLSLTFSVATFGSPIGLLRLDIPQNRFAGTQTAYALILFVSAGAVSFGYVMRQNADSDKLGFLVGSAAITTIATAMLPIWQWHQKVGEHFRLNFFLSLGKLLMLSASYYLAVSQNLSLVLIILFAGFLTYHFSPNPFSRQMLHINWKDLKGAMSFPLWLSGLSVFVYGRADTLLMNGFHTGMAEIGIYGYIYSLFSAVLMIPSVAQNQILGLFFKKKLSGAQIWKDGATAIACSGILATLIFATLAPIVVRVVAPLALNIEATAWALAPSVFAVFVAVPLGLALLDQHLDQLRAKIQLTAAAVNIGANLILIPHFGVLGAALATTASYIALFCLYLLFAFRKNLWEIRLRPYKMILFAVSIIITAIIFCGLALSKAGL